MAEKRGESSLAIYYLGKLFAALWVVGLLGLTVALATGRLAFIDHGVTRIGLMAACAGAAILAGIVGCRWARISYDGEGVTVWRNGRRQRYGWSEVERVFQVVGFSPPTYQMSFRTADGPVYFALKSWQFVSVIVWSWDFTDFAPWARERIREARGEGNRRDAAP